MDNERRINFRCARRGIVRAAAFLLALYVLTAATVAAHNYHTSLARMDYNAEKKLFEVSVQLFTHDLQPVLEKRLKKRVDLEKTPGIDREIEKYLSERFVMRDRAGERAAIQWAGREFEHDTVYVYFEMPLEPEKLSGSSLENTIFFESFAEQTNLVVVRYGDKKVDLLYKAGDRFKKF